MIIELIPLLFSLLEVEIVSFNSVFVLTMMTSFFFTVETIFLPPGVVPKRSVLRPVFTIRLVLIISGQDEFIPAMGRLRNGLLRAILRRQPYARLYQHHPG